MRLKAKLSGFLWGWRLEPFMEAEYWGRSRVGIQFGQLELDPVPDFSLGNWSLCLEPYALRSIPAPPWLHL